MVCSLLTTPSTALTLSRDDFIWLSWHFRDLARCAERRPTNAVHDSLAAAPRKLAALGWRRGIEAEMEPWLLVS